MHPPSPTAPFVYRPPLSPWLEVLHVDKDMVVVNKPAGLLSVPGRTPDLADSLLTRVQETHAQARIVHRLDMDTSGVMVVATRRSAERELRRQFRERIVNKVYVAEVAGTLMPDQGCIELPIGPAPSANGPRHRIDHENGRPASTAFEVLDRRERSTLVRLSPTTGRSHQLRVHMLALGHPILGDRFYGPQEAQDAKRLHLHALQLTLLHPYRAESMTFGAPQPF